jgi:hypothetical protein
MAAELKPQSAFFHADCFASPVRLTIPAILTGVPEFRSVARLIALELIL